MIKKIALIGLAALSISACTTRIETVHHRPYYSHGPVIVHRPPPVVYVPPPVYYHPPRYHYRHHYSRHPCCW